MNAALAEWLEKIKHSTLQQTLIENRNEIKHCPGCNANIEDRLMSMYAELAGELYAIYKWCGKNNQHEFKTRQIKHLLSHTGYARFGDFIRCSNGIVYRLEGKHKGSYGIHMGRAAEFFAGTRPIHAQLSINQITGQATVLKEAYRKDLPMLSAIIDQDGNYNHSQLL